MLRLFFFSLGCGLCFFLVGATVAGAAHDEALQEARPQVQEKVEEQWIGRDTISPMLFQRGQSCKRLK